MCLIDTFRDYIACIGATWIFMFSSVMENPRRWATLILLDPEFVKCSLCVGFWSGVLVYTLSKNPTYTLPLESSIICFLATLFVWDKYN